MSHAATPELSSDEARALFDAALDRELTADMQRAFEQALLRDAELASDYERQRALLSALESTPTALGTGEPIDLLAGVQNKLRARSGGKFYRDRFSQRRRGSGARGDALRWLIVLSACLIVAVLLWFAYDAGLLAIGRR